jgi:hypothetical protein
MLHADRLRRIGLVGAAITGILLVLGWLSKALLRGGAVAIYADRDRFS